MAQGTGIDVREDAVARKNKQKASQQALAKPRQEPDFDPNTMRPYQERPNPVSMAPAKAATKSAGSGLSPFGAAFAEARARLGPGQVFPFNGKMYSTNRADDVAGGGGASVGGAMPQLGYGGDAVGDVAADAGGGNWAADIDNSIMPWIASILGLGGGAAAATAIARRPQSLGRAGSTAGYKAPVAEPGIVPRPDGAGDFVTPGEAVDEVFPQPRTKDEFPRYEDLAGGGIPDEPETGTPADIAEEEPEFRQRFRDPQDELKALADETFIDKPAKPPRGAKAAHPMSGVNDPESFRKAGLQMQRSGNATAEDNAVIRAVMKKDKKALKALSGRTDIDAELMKAAMRVLKML